MRSKPTLLSVLLLSGVASQLAPICLAQAAREARAAKEAAREATPVADASTTHNVVITLPSGTSGTVSMASASDAANLASLLSQLQLGAARAGG